MTFGLFFYCLLVYIIGGMAASITYHRMLTHRSIEFVQWFERLLVMISLPAGTPIQWVGTHRQHHKYTDRKGDPHSPHLYGFWYAHCGWYIGQKNRILCFLYAIAGPIRMLIDGWMRPRSNQEYNHLAKDVAKILFYKKLSQPLNYCILVYTNCFFVVGVAYYFWQLKGLLAVWITLVVVYNVGDGINSFGHLFGEKINDHSEARNNTLLQYIAFGEGAHAFHHSNPRKSKFHTKKSNFDIGFLILLFLKKIGLIKKTH